MRRLYLRDAQPGDLLDDVFVFNNKQIANTASGKLYLKAFIGDKSGQFNVRMWNATQDLFKALPESGFVHVRGRVENYQGNLQIIMEHLKPPADGSYALDDLLPCTKKDIAVMFARLSELCGTIQNRQLGAIVSAFLADAELMTNFRRAPPP
ncbi:MAG: OB-fold nucleic acid binding domain-containing protein [Tepidisphaeraceae bacterium]